MTHGMFYVSSNNPNDVTGGGGCICSPEKQIDCKGPFIVVPGNEMDTLTSPYPVVCASCLDRMNELVAGEILDAGEDMTPLDPDATSESVSADLDDTFTI